MNIFYRGHVIHEEIRSICSTVYGRRPLRRELAACDSTMAAMQWVDRLVATEETTVAETAKQVALL